MLSVFKPLFLLALKIGGVVALATLAVLALIALIGFVIVLFRRRRHFKLHPIQERPVWAVYSAHCDACRHTTFRAQLNAEFCEMCNIPLPFKKIV